MQALVLSLYMGLSECVSLSKAACIIDIRITYMELETEFHACMQFHVSPAT